MGLIFPGLWLGAGAPAPDMVHGGLLYWPHRLLLWPWRWVATAVDPWFRHLPGWVDVVGTISLGLVPYAAADALLHAARRKTTKPDAFR